jgi:hypothetical protein
VGDKPTDAQLTQHVQLPSKRVLHLLHQRLPLRRHSQVCRAALWGDTQQRQQQQRQQQQQQQQWHALCGEWL